MNKYKFTGETRTIDHLITLHRIQRISDGLIGGWIESTKNLSQEGSCFVYNESSVLDFAVVKDDAQIMGDSVVCDIARVRGSAVVIDRVVCDDEVLE